MRRRALLAFSLLAACGDSSATAVDASTHDASHIDASQVDAGPITPGHLCDGLVTDLDVHEMTDLAKPDVGVPLPEAEFGTSVLRITAAPAGGAIVPMYSTIQAWNADETLLILYQVDGGHRLYDGKTYAYLHDLDINPSDVEHVYWHTSDPDILYYVDADTATFTRYHVSTGTADAVTTFPACDGAVSAGSDPMYISWDASVLGLRCDDGHVFTYRIDTDTVGPSLAWPGSDTAPQASASGALVYLDGEVRDLDMNLLRTLDLGNAFEHASLGQLATGEDTYNAVQYDPGVACPEGVLVTHSMVDGSCRVIVGEDNGYPYPPSGIHVSAIAYRQPGWVAVSIVGDHTDHSLLDDELVLADTNPGGAVCRIAHHHSWGGDGGQGYWGEPHPVISPTATRVIFGSDWGGSATVDTYVVELPSYAP